MALIDELRLEVNAVDAQLYALFSRRMELARKIGAAKDALGLPILDEAREEIVRQKARARVESSLAPYAEELCDTLLRLSRLYQAEGRVSE